MAKAFGLIMMLIALYIGMTIYTQGIEQAYGGIFAPIVSPEGGTPAATHLTPAAGMADAPMEPRPRKRVTEAVRDRVTADLQEGMRRRGY